MTVITAMLVDGYRYLNSRKLFWITLTLSGVMMLGFASIGFDEKGMFILFGLFYPETEYLTADSPFSTMLYRSLFVSFVSLWLSWAATILALVSTASLFPDFIAGGSIDLMLSRPIRRVTLFILKYLTGLLFVLLQVTVFTLGAYVCFGWRLGDWSPVTFTAIPLVVAFFSYLYAINVLTGIITRSALAALLLTILFWTSIFSVGLGEGIINMFRTQFEIKVERNQDELQSIEDRLALVEDTEQNAAIRDRLQVTVDEHRATLDASRERFEKLDLWHRGVRAVQWVLPKTGETIALLDRWLRDGNEVSLTDLMADNVATNPDGSYRRAEQSEELEVHDRMQAELDSRSLWYVIGTSLVFELVVLAVACAIFVRRDY